MFCLESFEIEFRKEICKTYYVISHTVYFQRCSLDIIFFLACFSHWMVKSRSFRIVACLKEKQFVSGTLIETKEREQVGTEKEKKEKKNCLQLKVYRLKT